jgi:DNA-binding transcriptional ArsR family regulator
MLAVAPRFDLDQMFRALADPTRRSVVERLGRGPATTTELAAPHPMALPSFMAHLDVLRDAGLVTSTKDGRSRVYTLRPEPLADAEDWLGRQRRVWDHRLDRFDDYVRTLKETPE